VPATARHVADGDPLSHRPVVNALAHRLDAADYLVAWRQRECGAREKTPDDRNVRVAYAALLDGYPYVPGRRLLAVDLDDIQLPSGLGGLNCAERLRHSISLLTTEDAIADSVIRDQFIRIPGRRECRERRGC
jgi:hypothetical protein